MTFKEASERWFSEYSALFQKKTTQTRNRQLSKRVYQHYGNLELSEINRSHIKQFMFMLSCEGANECNGKPLAYKTRKHYLTYISDVFNYCIDEGWIDTTPCTDIRVAPDKYDEEKELKRYTLEEAKAILELIKTEAPLKYRCFFFLTLCSGMRRGELMGLEWRDIDFENGIIRINRVSNYTSATGIYTDSPKTFKSKRSILIPNYVLELLKEYRKTNLYSRIFVQSNGNPMHNGTPYNWLKCFCQKYNLHFCGIHKFRHLYAAILINSGLDVATVSRCLGHSQVSTTLNIYAYAFNDAAARSCQAVSAALENELICANGKDNI